MKLLTELAEQISLLGKLKRVWFTSFNLSFEFFERHVLSTLLAMDTPRSRIDYELMQQRINGNSSPDDSGKIDIKLFVDQRMFNANDVKRTAIDVFAINPTRIDTIHRFGEQSLFHPKVIYLEDEYGRAILGVGSANLTLNGWSRNQEVFTFRKVASKPQIKAIQSFFLPLLKDNVLPVLARKRWGDDKNWQFVHSFQQESFLTKLFSKTNNDSKNRLSVWSPYFPEDLTGFICKLEKKIQSLTGNDESLILNLIPDRVENKYLRTKWHRKIAKWQKHGTLQFFSNPIVKHESSDLCHAKLWLTRNRLALGSWNFTTPGSNIHLGTDAATANIEAGIIFENDEAFKLENKFSVDKSDFMSDDKLRECALEVPFLVPFDVQVIFDWQSSCYHIVIESDEECLKQFSEYHLKLPDCDELPISNFTQPINKLVISEIKDLLTQHCFDIYRQGRMVHRGFIIEQQAQLRRVEHFATLDELFSNLIAGAPLEANPNASLRSELVNDQNSFDDIDGLFESKVPQYQSISYFRMFQALGQYELRLADVKSEAVLEQYVFVVPGCLLELREKITAQIAPDCAVFNWYMSQEFNLLLSTAIKNAEDLNMNDDFIERLTKLMIKSASLLKGDKGQRDTKKYQKVVRKRCGYET